MVKSDKYQRALDELEQKKEQELDRFMNSISETRTDIDRAKIWGANEATEACCGNILADMANTAIGRRAIETSACAPAAIQKWYATRPFHEGHSLLVDKLSLTHDNDMDDAIGLIRAGADDFNSATSFKTHSKNKLRCDVSPSILLAQHFRDMLLGLQHDYRQRLGVVYQEQYFEQAPNPKNPFGLRSAVTLDLDTASYLPQRIAERKTELNDLLFMYGRLKKSKAGLNDPLIDRYDTVFAAHHNKTGEKSIRETLADMDQLLAVSEKQRFLFSAPAKQLTLKQKLARFFRPQARTR